MNPVRVILAGLAVGWTGLVSAEGDPSVPRLVVDGKVGELRVRPRIKADFRLEDLSLPDGSRATVSCVGGKVTIRF